MPETTTRKKFFLAEAIMMNKLSTEKQANRSRPDTTSGIFVKEKPVFCKSPNSKKYACPRQGCERRFAKKKGVSTHYYQQCRKRPGKPAEKEEEEQDEREPVAAEGQVTETLLDTEEADGAPKEEARRYDMRPRKATTRPWFQCEYPDCDKGFTSQRALRTHHTKVHKTMLHGDTDVAYKSGGNAQAEGGRVQPHSATKTPFHRRHEPREHLLDGMARPVQPRLNLPGAGEKEEWARLDNKVDTELVKKLGSAKWKALPLDVMVDSFHKAAYESLAKLVGIVEPKGFAKKPTRRARVMAKLRKEKRELKRKWRRMSRDPSVTDEEIREHQSFWHKVVRLHNKMRENEAADEEATSVAKEETRFRKNPYKFARAVFAPTSGGKATFGVDKANDFFKATYADADRGHLYDLVPELENHRLPPPTHPFDMRAPTEEELDDIVRVKKNGSSPGPNGLPYLVYKKMPNAMRRRLHMIIVRVFEERRIPISWQMALVILLAKTDDTSEPELMRPIAKTNTDGKCFFTWLQRRTTRYMLDNEYIRLEIQKAFLPGIPGCLEFNQMGYDSIRKRSTFAHPVRAHILPLPSGDCRPGV
jgi:hypothetical protein